jgi:L-asparaginase
MYIKIFTTGGTIDKVYFDAKSQFLIGDPQIGEVLRGANVTIDYDVTPLMRKDSLELTDEDRQIIHDAIAAAPCKRIVITHGTDTMTTTAAVLRDIQDKTIVLTGSMQPARFHTTDAIYNIASAMTAAQLLPSGVYIAMNGQVFEADKARKNVEKNRFEVVE